MCIETNNKPLVSIIVPTYNSEKFIGACFDFFVQKVKEYYKKNVLKEEDGRLDRHETFDILKILKSPVHDPLWHGGVLF